MKTLIVLRHAKSLWDSKLRDIDRPITDKGRNRTLLISNFLKENNIAIDYVVSSPAVRAMETANIICTQQGFPLDNIVIDKNLYFVNTEKYYEAVFAISDEKNTALIIGHNPMITSFVNELISEPISNMPTSGLLVISFDTTQWNLILNAEKNITHLIFPKKLEKR